MPAAAFPPDEARRLESLRDQGILDSAPEAEFDDFAREAMEICGAPVGLISFVDAQRQWFKSHLGMEASETPRQQSFCAHALLTPQEPLIVPDATLDARFADSPLVTDEPHYRFYAGFPLRSPENLVLGTLCVLDRKPRRLSADQINRLQATAQRVSVRLSARRHKVSARRLAWSFGLGLLVLLGLAVFFAVQAVSFLASDEWVEHTQQVIRQIEQILVRVQATESNQRGYVASGQESYLAPYRKEVAALPAALAALRKSTSDNPIQGRNVADFQAAIEVKLGVMRERIEQRRTLGTAALDPWYLTGIGLQPMARTIALGNTMIELENTLLRQRTADRTRGLHKAVGMGLGTGVAGICLLGVGFLFTRLELRRSRALGAALANVNLDLEEEIADRRRAQRRLDMQSAVAHVAAGNVSLAAAVPAFLQKICESLEWPIGELWTLDRATDQLRLADEWHAVPEDAAEAACYDEFVAASRGWAFGLGEGLPGQVWARGTTFWEQDVQSRPGFLRTPPVQRAGLHRGCAFPLRAGTGNRITSVMVFLSREQGAPDTELVTAMETVAGQIAQFTERCRAEAGLRASQARFTAFIENAPALAYIKDDAGRMLYGNETLLRRFGLQADEWVGKTDADFWPDAAPALREADRKVLASQSALEVEETITEPDRGVTRWLSCKFPLRDEATGRQLLAGMSIDVTARGEAEEHRRAKDEAERTNLAKSQFLSRVSHELRTPLNAILGFGQLLGLSALPAKDEEALGYILKAGKHLLALVDEVLDLSRAESGELQITPTDVEVAGTVRDCVNLMAGLAEARGVVCEVQGVDDVPGLWCDEQRLRQTLLNLLSNAIKYNRAGGRVVVRCESAPGDRLRLLLSDTGPGIAPADLERLFVPFERLEQESGAVEGVGLGLVVSRRMVEAMGGILGVDSVVGSGSTFWVELPLSVGRPDEPPTLSLEAAEALELSPELLELFGSGALGRDL